MSEGEREESMFRPDKDRIPVGVDLIVETPNPEGLDTVLQSFGAALQQVAGKRDVYYVTTEEGYYRARCYGDPQFVRWTIENQGYAKVIREEVVT